MNTVKVPSSRELREIKVIENNEKLVDLKRVCPNVLINIAIYIEKNGGKKAISDACFAREEVAKKLKNAQSLLPKGYKLMIDCAYRSPSTQQKSYDAIYKKLQKEYPSWNQNQLEKEMDNRVSPVDIAPHSAGGALDLTVVDKNNQPLDMGTELDEFSNKTYTYSNTISEKQRENRNLLIKVMTEAGFVNFPAEWWHWSYGDREWGYHQKNKTAIYDIVNK